MCLIDEVDWVLHALKSELNFPVGAKDPLPLGECRFSLPLHALALFLGGDLPSRLRKDPEVVRLVREVDAQLAQAQHQASASRSKAFPADAWGFPAFHVLSGWGGPRPERAAPRPVGPARLRRAQDDLAFELKRALALRSAARRSRGRMRRASSRGRSCS